MNIFHDVTLADFSTMRLGGPAAHLAEIHSRDELIEALNWAKQQQLPVIMIGGGSNIIWRDEGFNGLVLVNRIAGYELFEEDESNIYVTIGAGENWDQIVARTVEAGLTGIEALSLIPGTAGATPIQNVGAYGQDISQTLTTLEAYDTLSEQLINLPAMDCGFGYRTSRFKTAERGRFIITSITLHLRRGAMLPPYYPALQRYIEEHPGTQTTPAGIRQAVIDIRSSKLPDPAAVANNGSFFANPIIDPGQLAQIQADSDLLVPNWPMSDGRVKVSAAWLVEAVGFKGVHDAETGMATWQNQALVVVNEAAHSTNDLLKFKQKIVTAVQAKFNITLEQEPELLPLA